MKKKVLFFTAHASHQKQSGVTLFVVIIFVLLSMLLALWASRTSIFGEMVVGNDADYQRAYEAAQALLLDAELDIRGERSDGRACAYGGLPSGSAATICRTGNTLKIPIETQDLPLFLADLENEPTRCKDGLCVKRVGRQDFGILLAKFLQVSLPERNVYPIWQSIEWVQDTGNIRVLKVVMLQTLQI